MLIGKRQDLGVPHGLPQCSSSADPWHAARAGTEQLHAVADDIAAAERSIKAGEGEAAANILQLAARALKTQSRWLASERMEQAIQALAATLSSAASAAHIQPAGVRRLHVLNRALPYGGHTAMAARWMTSGETGEIR